MEDVDLAASAALIGDPARAAMLDALLDGRVRPATELASLAGIAPSTASAHLARLLEGELIAVERRGRHRYYRLAGPQVAAVLESLAAIAPRRRVRSLRDAERNAAMLRARTCYDHLAGRLGVLIADALAQRGVLVASDSGWDVAAHSIALGPRELDIIALRRARRPLVRACLDWSERRLHIAGALGAALAATMFELGWIERRPQTRAIVVTQRGAAGLGASLDVDAGLLHAPVASNDPVSATWKTPSWLGDARLEPLVRGTGDCF